MRATWPNNKDNSNLAVFWPAQKITGKRVWQRHDKANVQDFSKWLTKEMNKVFLYGSDSINKNKHYWINHIKEREQQNDKEVEINKVNVPSLAVIAARQLWILTAKSSLSTVFFDTDVRGRLSNDCSTQFCIGPQCRMQFLQSFTQTFNLYSDYSVEL